MKIKTTLVSIIAAFAFVSLAGCATYKATLTNAQGHSITCEAAGKNGILTGSYLRSGFDDCVAKAEAHGYSTNSGAKDSQAPSAPLSCPAGYTCKPKNQ